MRVVVEPMEERLSNLAGVKASSEWIEACKSHLLDQRLQDNEDEVLHQIIHTDLRNVVRRLGNSNDDTNEHGMESQSVSDRDPSVLLRRAVCQSSNDVNNRNSRCHVVIPENFRCMLQIEELLDISLNAESRLSMGPASISSPNPVGNQRKRCLKMLLTDGYYANGSARLNTNMNTSSLSNQSRNHVQNFVAVETHPITSLSVHSKPGIKILLTGPIHVRLGILMLSPLNTFVIGGCIPELIPIQKKALDCAAKVAGVGIDATFRALVYSPESGLEEENDEGEQESGDVLPVSSNSDRNNIHREEDIRTETLPRNSMNDSTTINTVEMANNSSSVVNTVERRSYNLNNDGSNNEHQLHNRTAATIHHNSSITSNSQAQRQNLATHQDHTNSSAVSSIQTQRQNLATRQDHTNSSAVSTSTTQHHRRVTTNNPYSRTMIVPNNRRNNDNHTKTPVNPYVAAAKTTSYSNPYNSSNKERASSDEVSSNLPSSSQPVVESGIVVDLISPSNNTSSDMIIPRSSTNPVPACDIANVNVNKEKSKLVGNNTYHESSNHYRQQGTLLGRHGTSSSSSSRHGTILRSPTALSEPLSFSELRSLLQKIVSYPSSYEQYYEKTFIVPCKMHSKQRNGNIGFNVEKKKNYKNTSKSKSSKSKAEKYGYMMVCQMTGPNETDGSITCKLTNDVLCPFLSITASELRKLSQDDKEKANKIANDGGSQIISDLRSLVSCQLKLLHSKEEFFSNDVTSSKDDVDGDKPVLHLFKRSGT